MNKIGVRGVVFGFLVGVACCLLFLNLTDVPATAAAQGKPDVQHWYQMAGEAGEYVIDQATGDIYTYSLDMRRVGERVVRMARWTKTITGPPKAMDKYADE